MNCQIAKVAEELEIIELLSVNKNTCFFSGVDRSSGEQGLWLHSKISLSNISETSALLYSTWNQMVCTEVQPGNKITNEKKCSEELTLGVASLGISSSESMISLKVGAL
jgi:hypothetical protein